MERLTERFDDGILKGILVKEKYGEHVPKTLFEEVDEGYLGMCVLKAYEDTGLAPEQIEELLSRENASEITRSSRDNEVTECCPHCDREITVSWDVEQDGYQIFCPNCGEPIMLCSMCDRGPCDWTENGCKYSDDRYGKRKDGRRKYGRRKYEADT